MRTASQEGGGAGTSRVGVRCALCPGLRMWGFLPAGWAGLPWNRYPPCVGIAFRERLHDRGGWWAGGAHREKHVKVKTDNIYTFENVIVTMSAWKN